jgi:hypothetical protein
MIAGLFRAAVSLSPGAVVIFLLSFDGHGILSL